MRRTMRRTPLLLTLALAACASSGSVPDPEIARERPMTVGDRDVIHLTESAPDRVTLAAPPEKVWNVLLALYPKLEIPLTTIDTPNQRLGNTSFTKMRQLAGDRMSVLLNCGTNMTGSKADNDRIYMSVLSTVRPDGAGGTLLVTHVTAEAAPVDGTSTDRSPCGSSGLLEKKIAQSVAATLGVSAK